MSKYGAVFGSPAMIIALFAVAGIIVGFLIIQMLKNKRRKQSNQDNFEPAKTVIQSDDVKSYSCLCGFKTTKMNYFSNHLRMSKKGKHALLKEKKVVIPQAASQATPQVITQAAAAGTYAAMAFTARGITFPKIDSPMGRPLYLGTSMPGHHGSHYMVREIGEGKYEAYDPRELPFDAAETPSRCYKATHVYDLIRALFANKYGLLDKINYLIMGLLIVCSFFILLTLIDKVGK
jgi:uncharacterized membrane protein YuzA (DUF378 family)